MTTPPWRASGAPSNSNWSIAVTLLTSARTAAKSSTISKLSTIASALTALWVTFLPLTSNSKTTNQNDRFYCPFFRGKPNYGRISGRGGSRQLGVGGKQRGIRGPAWVRMGHPDAEYSKVARAQE